MPALSVQMVESALRIIKRRENRPKRQRLKSATKTMIVIVMSYLICNSLRLVLTFWENISPETLKSENFKFYSLGGDVVSLLTAINASWKLIIYYTCNPKIRKEVQLLARKISFQPIRTEDRVAEDSCSTSSNSAAKNAETLPALQGLLDERENGDGICESDGNLERRSPTAKSSNFSILKNHRHRVARFS